MRAEDVHLRDRIEQRWQDLEEAGSQEVHLRSWVEQRWQGLEEAGSRDLRVRLIGRYLRS